MMRIPRAENYRLAFPFQVPRRSGTAVCERAGVTVINPASVTMVASFDIAGLLIRVLRAPSPQRSFMITFARTSCSLVRSAGLHCPGLLDDAGQGWGAREKRDWDRLSKRVIEASYSVSRSFRAAAI